MSKHLLTALAVAAGLAIFAFTPMMRALPWTPMRIAGLALGIPSFFLWVLARKQLGDSFSIRAEARALVTHGLYSRIRNPIYVFGSLVICSMILYSNQPVFFLIFLILIPLQIVRARKESSVLEEKFGEEYCNYKKRTWF
jgi:protein-S-isoprenylcysteine O-methyltransferase Ste14